MARFTYIAMPAEGGAVVTGRIKGKTISQAREQLRARGLVVESLQERPSALFRPVGGHSKVSRDEVMHFSRQLAAFVRSGVPLLEAVDTIGEESPNPGMRATMHAIGEALRSGDRFSDAVAAHPRIFPPFYVAVVRSAELTGNLDSVLDQVSRYLERDLEARRKIRSALTYPGIVLVLTIGTVGVLTGFVLPRFRSFFDSFDAALPLPTRVLLGISGFVGHWWWAIAGAMVAALFGGFVFLKTDAGKRGRDALLLKIPLVSTIIRFSVTERFCRMLGSMVNAGVPLPDAMAASGDAAGNAVFRAGLAGAREGMMRGDGFAMPIARTGLFPGAMNQMLRVGEGTGTLDAQLESAAEFYESELAFKVRRMTTLFEPTVIVIMGLTVGFVALALVSAMFGVVNQAGGSLR